MSPLLRRLRTTPTQQQERHGRLTNGHAIGFVSLMSEHSWRTPLVIGRSLGESLIASMSLARAALCGGGQEINCCPCLVTHKANYNRVRLIALIPLKSVGARGALTISGGWLRSSSRYEAPLPQAPSILGCSVRWRTPVQRSAGAATRSSSPSAKRAPASAQARIQGKIKSGACAVVARTIAALTASAQASGGGGEIG